MLGCSYTLENEFQLGASFFGWRKSIVTAAELYKFVQDVAGQISVQSTVLALGLIAGLQFVYGRLWHWLIVRTPDVDVEYQHFASELEILQRDRTLSRLENQILRDILGQNEFDKALLTLLRHFASPVSQHFAAVLPLGAAAGAARHTRGLTEASIRVLRLDGEALKYLKDGRPIILEGLPLQRSELFAALSPEDRRKAKQLFVIGVGDEADPFAALVTTNLIPSWAERHQQLELTRRLLATVAGNLKQLLTLEQQSSQLRNTREMLELRSIADAPFEQPLKTIERFLLRLIQQVGADRAAFFLSGRDAGAKQRPLLRCGASLVVGIDAVWQRHEESLAQLAVIQPQLMALDLEALKRAGIDSLMSSAVVVPVRHQQRVIGVLCLSRRTVGVLPQPSQLPLLEWAGTVLGDTIHKSLNYAAMERQAKHDGLTDLANRRTFDLQLQRECELLNQAALNECSLLLCDLDRFKQVNDVHGHQAGDEVLRNSARLLREQVGKIRATDRAVMARYGGEEMAVLLPGVGLAGALRIAEAIRRTIADSPVALPNGSLAVTISIGVACAPNHGGTPASLLAAADAALYAAKEQGRNRVIAAATGEPSESQIDPVSSGSVTSETSAGNAAAAGLASSTAELIATTHPAGIIETVATASTASASRRPVDPPPLLPAGMS